MAYIPMVGSPIINVLVYKHNCGLPVTLPIVLQTPVCISPKQLFRVYTPVSSSPI